MLGDDKVIKKTDQEEGAGKEMSADLDGVVTDGTSEETTFEQNRQ